MEISIHALLAESDPPVRDVIQWEGIFLSTLSLRRATQEFACIAWQFTISIHALLAESDHSTRYISSQRSHFYPRSPCGERLLPLRGLGPQPQFLSTLSLRRATHGRYSLRRSAPFLSTLSLRRATTGAGVGLYLVTISIHALLAESDYLATWQPCYLRDFYPRSPCGERRSGHR